MRSIRRAQAPQTSPRPCAPPSAQIRQQGERANSSRNENAPWPTHLQTQLHPAARSLSPRTQRAMNISTKGAALTALLLFTEGIAVGADKPFAAVQSAVKSRTGRDVRWESDLQAREESRTRARMLLRRPLTV